MVHIVCVQTDTDTARATEESHRHRTNTHTRVEADGKQSKCATTMTMPSSVVCVAMLYLRSLERYRTLVETCYYKQLIVVNCEPVLKTT